MAALPPWDDLIAGKGCPFCGTRADDDGFNIRIADFSVSTLYLDRDQTYPFYSVLIFKKRHVTGLEQLTDVENLAFAQDLKRAAQAISTASGAPHMNYASLGNVIPHLHYHIIPRTPEDPRWGGPVWLTHLSDMKKKILPDDGYPALIEKIRAALK